MSTLSDFGVPLTKGHGGLLRWVLEPQAHVGKWVGLHEGKIICMQTLEHVKILCDALYPDADIVQITDENKDNLVWAQEKLSRGPNGEFYANVPDDSLHWNTHDKNS